LLEGREGGTQARHRASVDEGRGDGCGAAVGGEEKTAATAGGGVTNYEAFIKLLDHEATQEYPNRIPEAAEMIALIRKDANYCAALTTLTAMYLALSGPPALLRFNQRTLILAENQPEIKDDAAEPAA
jgi:hypothetical protein